MVEADSLEYLFTILIYLLFYIFLFGTYYLVNAISLYKIAQKFGRTDAWKAWIPFIQGAYQLQLGDFSPYLYFLILIPVFGLIPVIVLGIISWIKITEKRGFPLWIGLMAALSWTFIYGGMIATYVTQLYIAFSEYKKKDIEVQS